jgi:hypothetical protein
MHDGFRPVGRGMALLAAVLFLLLLTGPRAAQAELVLNEFLANPGQDWDGDGEVDSKLDEWVEVYNAGSETLDLTLYWIRDALNEEPNLNLFGTLAPGETAVFYGSHAVAWQIEHGLPTPGLSLNNGGDTVVLMKTDPDDPINLLTIDSFQYTAHVGAVDRSCGRLPDGGEWALFDGLNPYNGSLFPEGTGCDPSPGENHLCDEGTPISAARWAEVKHLWQ